MANPTNKECGGDGGIIISYFPKYSFYAILIKIEVIWNKIRKQRFGRYNVGFLGFTVMSYYSLTQ